VAGIPLRRLDVPEPHPLLAERLLGGLGRAAYLLRPDQHVAARWPEARAESLAAALRRAVGLAEEAVPCS
jgi:3-(3-hydroxy-phenyl)propionate hydroxylase